MEDVKIYLASDLYDNLTKYLIMQGTKALTFDYKGEYKGEVPALVNFGVIDEVDLVSILHYEGGYELATHINRKFTKLKPQIPLHDLYSNLTNHRGVLYRAVRSGEKNGLKFKQYFFTFKPNVLNPNVFA